MSRPSRPILLASNRGPVAFGFDDGGRVVARRGGGGLVTALSAAVQEAGGLWIAAAMSDADRRQAAGAAASGGRIDTAVDGAHYRLRYLPFEPDVFDDYYNQVSNRILWFLHHYLWDVPTRPRFGADTRRAWEHYTQVNRAFADALAEEAGGLSREPVFLVQDYHLALVPAMLRERRPGARIAHFSHTSFAGPDYFRLLPKTMGRALIHGLLGADVLGFQADAWAENFLLCCRGMPDVSVDLRRRRVEVDGRPVLVRSYPISVDPAKLRDMATSPEVRRIRRRLRGEMGDRRLILRVDRTELSKNILRSFLAYEEFLRRYPEWRERVRFMALLNPSRRAVPEYAAYTRACEQEAERINRELGTEGWTPIELEVRDDYPQAIAALGLYDVLFLTPVFDGMNLVSVEGPILNRANGSLVLSRNTGAWALLSKHAIGVNPFDLGEMAEALQSALTMSDEERARRARGLRRAISSKPLSRWVQRQLDDIERVAAEREGLEAAEVEHPRGA